MRPTPRALLTTLALLLSLASVAHAQDELVTPEPLQFDLYQQGAAAYAEGDYQKAIKLFEASLELGPLNITWLNLGRTYFKLGLCDKANEAYAQARISPRVASPTPLEVLKKIDEFSAELPTACPALIVVSCHPPEMEVFVAGQGPLPCDGQPITVLPGQHTVVGALGQQKVERLIAIKGMERQEVALVLMSGAAPEPGEEPETPRPAPGDALALPSSIYGAGLGLKLADPANVEVASGGDTVEFQGDGLAAPTLSLMAGWRLLDAFPFYLGARLGFIPGGFEFEGLDAPGLSTEINLLALKPFPLGDGTWAPYILLELGLMTFYPDEQEDNLVGPAIGTGGGLRWRLTDTWTLNAELRIQAYSLQIPDNGQAAADRTNATGGPGDVLDGSAQESLALEDVSGIRGTRFTLLVGATFDL